MLNFKPFPVGLQHRFNMPENQPFYPEAKDLAKLEIGG